ncbi:MAG: glycosyltransferase [Saprospiraceae bacterium]|nr:MAG: group 1 glycosyl transferase [Bacteroidetes bacterium OLB9]MCO6464032.1 glycosyltransferase [Saprospiraceae bacterium]MCZ2338423.1 glycosyltransferase [Chitinophagales bacterium]
MNLLPLLHIQGQIQIRVSKIIIIGPAYPLRGGLATFNERMARAFQKLGHEVVIYTFSLQYPNFLFPGKTQLSESDPPSDLKIYKVINSINPLNWWKVGRTIRNVNADLVIFRFWLPFMGPCLGSIARMIRKNKVSKVLAIVDNAIPHEKRPGDRLLTNYFVKSVQYFVTMSPFVKKDLSLFTAQNISVIHHPLYDNFGTKYKQVEARKALDIPEKGTIYLFFGFIRKYKGLDILVDAFGLLPDIDDKYLLIAGEYYAGEAEIKDQIQQSPVKKHIIEHTRFIKDEDVGLYFSAADVVVQPYRHATQSGVTPLAYHFEVPMIVTNVGALPELVPHTLGIVTQPNKDDLAKALMDFLQFDIASFSSEIKKEKKKLSWDALVKSILEEAEIES